jgi:hypothetical protein
MLGKAVALGFAAVLARLGALYLAAGGFLGTPISAG